jgi:hypothetical protein
MTRKKVPTIAGNIPPPVIPSDGAVDKNFQLILGIPLYEIITTKVITINTIENAQKPAIAGTPKRPTVAFQLFM